MKILVVAYRFADLNRKRDFVKAPLLSQVWFSTTEKFFEWKKANPNPANLGFAFISVFCNVGASQIYNSWTRVSGWKTYAFDFVVPYSEIIARVRESLK